jgi:hypothetical protein
MANITELMAAGNSNTDRVEADRVATAAAKAGTDARSTAVTEGDRLCAEGTRAR